jgi:predicted nucleic acid-binding protein
VAERKPAKAFVDTSVFIRFMTRDDEAKAERSRALLEEAQAGQVELHVNHLLLAEIGFTLRSVYGLPRPSIAERLSDLLDVRGLRVPDRTMIAETIESYAGHNVSFADAYFAVDMKRRGLRTIYAYDTDFDKLGVRRLEP